MLSEVSQTDKDKYHMISLMCGIFKKSFNNRNRSKDTENKLIVAAGKGCGEMGEIKESGREGSMGGGEEEK